MPGAIIRVDAGRRGKLAHPEFACVRPRHPGPEWESERSGIARSLLILPRFTPSRTSVKGSRIASAGKRVFGVGLGGCASARGV